MAHLSAKSHYERELLHQKDSLCSRNDKTQNNRLISRTNLAEGSQSQLSDFQNIDGDRVMNE